MGDSDPLRGSPGTMVSRAPAGRPGAVHLVHWASLALFVGGAAIHMVLTGEFFDTASHWVMAAGMVLAAYDILRPPARVGEGVGTVDVSPRS